MAPDRDDRSGSPDPDVDALFAQIVAGWDDEQTMPVPPWPATEDLPERTGQKPPEGPSARRETGDRTDGTDRRSGGEGRTGEGRIGERRGVEGRGVEGRGVEGRGGEGPGARPEDGSPATGDRPDRRAPGRRGGSGQAPQGRDRRRPGVPSDSTGGPGRHVLPGSEPTAPPASDPTGSGSGTDSPTPPGPPVLGPRDWASADEPHEGFVPPEPPPLPRGDLVGRLAWAGVLLGPAFLLLSALVWDDAGPLPLALATLAFVGGFITLVARMPAHRDDGDDDGAVV